MYDYNGVKTPIQRMQENWIKITWAWNLQLNYVHGMQNNWMDQQIIYEDKWDTYRTSCYDPNSKSLNKGTSTINHHSK